MKKYRPSNGTEGEAFIDIHCRNCIHGLYEHTCNTDDNPCEILSRSFLFDVNDEEYPKEWIVDETGKASCTEFKKWDWGFDDEGRPTNMPPELPSDDLNQLCMPFIFDEIGVPKVVTEKKSVLA